MSSDESIFRRIGNRIVEFEGLGRSQGGRGTTDLGDEVIEFDRIADPDDIGEASEEGEKLGITIEPSFVGEAIKSPMEQLRLNFERDFTPIESIFAFNRALDDVKKAEPSFKVNGESGRKRPLRRDVQTIEGVIRTKDEALGPEPNAAFGGADVRAVYEAQNSGVEFPGNRACKPKDVGQLFRADIWEECRNALERLISYTPPTSFESLSSTDARRILTWCIRVSSTIGIMRKALNLVHLETIDEEVALLPDGRKVDTPHIGVSRGSYGMLGDFDGKGRLGQVLWEPPGSMNGRILPLIWYGPKKFPWWIADPNRPEDRLTLDGDDLFFAKPWGPLPIFNGPKTKSAYSWGVLFELLMMPNSAETGSDDALLSSRLNGSDLVIYDPQRLLLQILLSDADQVDEYYRLSKNSGVSQRRADDQLSGVPSMNSRKNLIEVFKAIPQGKSATIPTLTDQAYEGVTKRLAGGGTITEDFLPEGWFESHTTGVEPTVAALRHAASVYASKPFPGAAKKCISRWQQRNFGNAEYAPALNWSDAKGPIESIIENPGSLKNNFKKPMEAIYTSIFDEKDFALNTKKLPTEEEAIDRAIESAKNTRDALKNLLDSVQKGASEVKSALDKAETAVDRAEDIKQTVESSATVAANVSSAADNIGIEVDASVEAKIKKLSESTQTIGDALEVSSKFISETDQVLSNIESFSIESLRGKIETEVRDQINDLYMQARQELVSSVSDALGISAGYIQLAVNLAEVIFGKVLGDKIGEVLEFIVNVLTLDLPGDPRTRVNIRLMSNLTQRWSTKDGCNTTVQARGSRTITSADVYQSVFQLLSMMEQIYTNEEGSTLISLGTDLRASAAFAFEPQPQFLQARDPGITDLLSPKDVNVNPWLGTKVSEVIGSKVDVSDAPSARGGGGSRKAVAGVLGAAGIAIPVGVALFQQGIIGGARQLEAGEASPPEDEREAEEEEEA